MTRLLQPEILDGLPPDDPRARGSRRDLRRINALMGNARVVAGLLGSAPRRVLEIGAGDGAFMRAVARHLRQPLSPPEERGTILLLDRQPHPTPDIPGWRVETVVVDVFDRLQHEERFDAIVANLFLHHFEDAPLRRLLALVAERTDLFVACEPRRSALGLAGCRTLGLIGCNRVTRHDAWASVLAGFRDRELSALWPSEGWTLVERAVPPFSHAFRAERAR